jgi:Gluconate 2-dehydrogenase subunit 3
MVTGALAQPKTAEAPDASHGHDSGEGHGAKLSAAGQVEMITAIKQSQAGEFTYPSAQAFFNAIRTHTTEGMLAAPIYGGNKDFAKTGSLACTKIVETVKPEPAAGGAK